MADYTIADGDIACHAKTLSPNTEDTVTFPHIDENGVVTLIVYPGGTSPVYVSSGSTPATVAGPQTRVLFPGFAGELTGPSGKLSGLDGASTSPPTKVRLISASAVTYSVEA
jgi:hypothetical protein